jgi:hypothetical protein
MGYQPNGTAAQMRSIDIWRVKDGKLIERLLDVVYPPPRPDASAASASRVVSRAASQRPYLS